MMTTPIDGHLHVESQRRISAALNSQSAAHSAQLEHVFPWALYMLLSGQRTCAVRESLGRVVSRRLVRPQELHGVSRVAMGVRSRTCIPAECRSVYMLTPCACRAGAHRCVGLGLDRRPRTEAVRCEVTIVCVVCIVQIVVTGIRRILQVEVLDDERRSTLQVYQELRAARIIETGRAQPNDGNVTAHNMALVSLPQAHRNESKAQGGEARAHRWICEQDAPTERITEEIAPCEPCMHAVRLATGHHLCGVPQSALPQRPPSRQEPICQRR